MLMLFIFVLSIGLLFLSNYLSFCRKRNNKKESCYESSSFLEEFGCVVGIVLLVVTSCSTTISYFCHANDIGVIRGQSRVIAVYEQNVDALEEKLRSLKEYRGALMNNDAPITSLVNSITSAMHLLARAKEIKADAYVSIEKRKAGPWSFLVDESDLQ